MANTTQNGAPVFVAPTPTVNPGIYYTSPDSAYPPAYIISQQQQQPSASGKYDVLLGKTSALWLGVALVLCGVLSQIGAAVAFRFYAGFSEAGVGVWCGYMFTAAGAVAIVTCHYGTKKLIFATAITSGLAVVAAIIQLAVAAAGIDKDDYYYEYNSYYYGSGAGAKGGNGTMVFAATLALIGATWLLGIGYMAIRREQTTFQDVSAPVQYIPNAPQSNIYEDIRKQQMDSKPVQHEQQLQQYQTVPLIHQQSNTIHPPMSSQIVQMPAPYIQTITISTMPSQQMFSVPMATVHQNQHQQSTSLNHPPPNTIDPATSSQLHGHHEAPKNHDVEKETLSVTKE